MRVVLQSLSREHLRELAQGVTPPGLAARTLPGALPPARVAARALARLDAGQAQPWCEVFAVATAADGAIVAGCGFKGEPVDGRAGIFYGVAPAQRRRGIAAAAVRLLVARAFAQGAQGVLADILPGNIASERTVQACGFVRVGKHVAEDGEVVVQWLAHETSPLFMHPVPGSTP
ncbi:MAG TPA: GNAT family protein [Frateuria sp.]|uniref:GNAT family N-acetyltransferase n=1 Tax=Frateuria sp. TaxID=2211372 RepID=UPI002D7F72A7|nr:GNAT family protein [Frateuria sp.]HET6805358.1 GNAT family protein [Frateuria sp.]